MRKSWTDSMVSSEVFKIADGSGIMPTVSLLKELGRNDLSNQISRRGGYGAWARKLGLRRNASDSDFGWDGEKRLADILTSRGHSVVRHTAVKNPFDLTVDEIIRVDVKTARFAEYGASRGWFYRIGKVPQADIVALLQFDTGDVYFFPWHLCPTTNITISHDGGSHVEFKNRFDLLSDSVKQRQLECSIWPPLNANRGRRIITKAETKLAA